LSERPEVVLEQRAREYLDRIPGYRGYRLKEERRDADRRVREAVADAFAAELARVERIGRELANARRLGEIGAVERASQAIRHFIDRVRTASPGYGGLFGERDIDGVALDQIRLFDESLILGVDELRPAVDRLEAAMTAGQPVGPPADQVTRTMDSLLARLDARQEVVSTGHAAARASVLAALEPIAAIVPREVYAALPGDAVSILGDDHLVDARIEVDGQPKSFRLLRIGKEPEEWLFVERDPEGVVARLSPVEAPASGAALADPGLKQVSAGTGDGEVVGAEGSSGLRPVRYALLNDAGDAERFGVVLHWDGERQAFAGRRIEPLDLEVYRRTGNTGQG
jgi:hypothetical protein